LAPVVVLCRRAVRHLAQTSRDAKCVEGNAGKDHFTNSRSTARASAVHEKVSKIIIELKQLELLAAEIEESAISRLLAAVTDGATTADAAHSNLDAAQRYAQVNTFFYSFFIVISLTVSHFQEWLLN